MIMNTLKRLLLAAAFVLTLSSHTLGQAWMIPARNGAGSRSISPNSITGGPVLWLQARPEYFGTTGARSFDGEQYVELDSYPAITTNDFSISFFVKWSGSTEKQGLVAWGGLLASDSGVSIVLAGDQYIELWLNDKTHADISSGYIAGDITDAALTENEWHHVVILANRDGVASCYLDNVLQTATIDISGHQDTLAPEKKYLGAWWRTTTNLFTGALSKLAYFDELLTPTEIAELYNSGNGITRAMYSAGLAAKTVHSWNCNEAPEATLYDSTGTNDGTPSLPATNLVSNGGFEDRTGDNFDDLDEHAFGSSSVNAETSDVQAGSVSCRFEVDASNSGAYITCRDVLTAGCEYEATWQAKGSDACTMKAEGNISPILTKTLTTDWQEFSGTFVATGENITFNRASAASKSIYLDSISVVRTGPHVGSTAGPEATNVTDSVGSNNGLAVNMDVANVSNDIPTALAGTGIKSLSFDGVEELVEVANDDSLRIADTVTLSCWFKTTDDTSRMTLLTKRYNEYELAIESNNKALAWYGDAGGYDDLVRDSIPAYANGAWHHVTAAIDKANGTLDVVFDGVAQTQVTGGVDRSGTQGTNVLTVGMRSGVSNEFTGSLCDCRVYNKLLSTAESQSLAAGTDVTDGLVSRWKFDDQWSTSASNGDTIASWTCKATGSVFAQETAAFRPVYRASGIGGSGAIELDGVDDFLELSSAILGGDSGAVFYVAAFDAGAAGCSLLSQADAASEDNHLSFGINSGSSIFLDSKDAGTRHYVLGGSSVDDGTARVVACVSNGTSWSLFVNNVELSPLTVGTSNSGKWFGDISLCDALTVGRKSSSSPAGNFDGKVAEIIAYEGTVSEDERSRLSKRLAAQYGIAL
jgi:hypothetical protein